MPDLVLLISGPVAVGKTSLRDELIVNHGFGSIRSSEYLRKVASQNEAGADRHSLQDLGDDLDQKTDFKWVVDDVALPAIEASPLVRRWLFDAVRKRRQVEHFRSRFGERVWHVHLIAAEDVLRQRYEKRVLISGQPGGDSYEKAILHDNEQESRSLVSIADYVVSTYPADIKAVVEEVLAFLKIA